MAGILQRLKTEVLIGMGATGTNLASKGYDQTGLIVLWIIDHPDIYQDFMKSWVDAGCDLVRILVADRFSLKRFGLEDKAPEINLKLVRLTKEVIPDTCYLGWNLAASAMMLPPVGNASVDEVYKSYVEQVVVARDTGVDFFEVPGNDIVQTGLAIKAAKENSKIPVAALLHSINPTPKGFRNLMGIDPTTGARKFEEFGADAIGIACGGINYKETTAVLREMKAACNKPLWARPNAGVPELIDGRAVHPGTPEGMAEEAPNWVEAGARVVEGCCGTTPEHIAKVVAALKSPG